MICCGGTFQCWMNWSRRKAEGGLVNGGGCAGTGGVAGGRHLPSARAGGSRRMCLIEARWRMIDSPVLSGRKKNKKTSTFHGFRPRRTPPVATNISPVGARNRASELRLAIRPRVRRAVVAALPGQGEHAGCRVIPVANPGCRSFIHRMHQTVRRSALVRASMQALKRSSAMTVRKRLDVPTVMTRAPRFTYFISASVLPTGMPQGLRC